MSVSFVNNMDPFTIINGATDSQVLSADYDYGDAAALGIGGSTSNAGTLSIQVSWDGTTWYTYQEGSPAADYTLPANGKAAICFGVVSFPYIRLHGSATNSGGSTVIKLSKHFTVGAGLG